MVAILILMVTMKKMEMNHSQMKTYTEIKCTNYRVPNRNQPVMIMMEMKEPDSI
jgi:hypothetical protein